jgi:hypothetical protein
MAHGWSTGVLPALTHDLLGAGPTSPGYATWEVRPQPGDVAWAQGQLPTPHGALRVAWQNSGRTFHIVLDVPKETRGTLVLPGDGRRLTVRARGRTLWDGRHAATDGLGVVDGRVTISGLGPGTHDFTARRDT